MGTLLLLLFRGAMYREVLDTALLASGPGDGCVEGWIVIIETAEIGLGAIVSGVGLGWGGRNITEVTDPRDGVEPGTKGRAVRFRMLGLGLKPELLIESGLGLGPKLELAVILGLLWSPF